MLCAKCKAREATVHHTIIDGDKLEKIDFCEQCAGPLMREEKGVRFQKIVDLVRAKPPKGYDVSIKEIEQDLVEEIYSLEAFEFVSEASDFCQREKPVSARELLDSICVLARRKFGGRAKEVLGKWKIFGTHDFWNIIALLKVDEKRFVGAIDEFNDAFNFDDVFPEK